MGIAVYLTSRVVIKRERVCTSQVFEASDVEPIAQHNPPSESLRASWSQGSLLPDVGTVGLLLLSLILYKISVST